MKKTNTHRPTGTPTTPKSAKGRFSVTTTTKRSTPISTEMLNRAQAPRKGNAAKTNPERVRTHKLRENDQRPPPNILSQLAYQDLKDHPGVISQDRPVGFAPDDDVDTLNNLEGRLEAMLRECELQDGELRSARHNWSWQRWVPLYPGPNDLKVATYPPPLYLKKEMSVETQVRLMMRTWIQACLAYYGKKDWSLVHVSRLMKADPKTRRQLLYSQPLAYMLIKAAQALITNAIPPAGWVSFRFHQWRNTHEKNHDLVKANMVPPVRYVFDSKKVEEHAGWYRRNFSGFMVGHLMPTDATMNLIRDYERMVDDIQRLPGAITKENVLAVFHKHFPGDSYAGRFESAKKAERDRQAVLDTAVRNGDCNWLVWTR